MDVLGGPGVGSRTVQDSAVLASVVIPAHNEERVIPRTLARLQQGLPPGALDVVVVCNGCTDGTAAAARLAAPGARVIEIEQPSKAAAVRAGNGATDVFPRVHLDADVELSGSDLAALVQPLREGAVLATAPRRVLRRDHMPWLVRSYYDVWEQLPQVRSGLFGRGVFALSAAGQARVSALPPLMNDDLATSDAFTPDERRVVDEAEAVVVPPRTVRDLVRRRTRVATGGAQAAGQGARRPESVTTWRALGHVALARPTLALRVPVFVGVALVARAASRGAVRRGDFSTWLRDESSRA